MRRELVKYFHNARMNDELNIVKLPFSTYIQYGSYDFDNFNEVRLGRFHCKIGCDANQLLLFAYKMSIYVNDIKVYEDGWVHNIPKSMKQEFKEEIVKMKSFNKECQRLKISKQYHKYQKDYKKKLKIAEKENFKAEQQELKKLFDEK